MLITDELVYIELHKTGCTHTEAIIKDMYPKSVIIGKHNTYNSIPKDILSDFDNKVKIGNIRNPWDWYVSLWAFGCQHKGLLYQLVTKSSNISTLPITKRKVKSTLMRCLGKEYKWLDSKIWKQLYSDVNNFDNFNIWLNIILSKSKIEIGEGYKKSNISNFSGLLTYRYLNLFTYKNTPKSIKSFSELIEYDKENNFMDIIIKNEAINDGITKLAKELNYQTSNVNDILNKYQNRTNASIRDRNYRAYYTEDSIKLIEDYEKFIINKYNYSFE